MKFLCDLVSVFSVPGSVFTVYCFLFCVIAIKCIPRIYKSLYLNLNVVLKVFFFILEFYFVVSKSWKYNEHRYLWVEIEYLANHKTSTTFYLI